MRSGTLTWQEGSAAMIVILLSQSFLLEPSFSIARSGTAAWSVKLISGIAFWGAALAVEQMYHRHLTTEHGDRSFARFVARYVGKTVQKAVWIVWVLLLMFQLAFMFRIVAESMSKIALLQSEIFFPLILFGGGVMIASYRTICAVLRAGYLIVVGTILLFILLIVSLMPLWEMELIFPWQGFGYAEMIRQAGADIGTWCGGSVIFLLFPLMGGCEECRHSLRQGVLTAVVVKCAFLLAVLGIFGSTVGAERSFLVYEMAKLVHFSQYIQRVEAMFVCIWVMVVFLAMVILVQAILILLGDVLQVTDRRPLTGTVVTMAVIGAASFADPAMAIEWAELLTYTVATSFFVLMIVLLAGGVGYAKRSTSQ